ncbi:HAMP domain-containing sensor histidine kinase [Tropicimonas sp. IMCC6043]|uniref:sensor histidine kinase n=1 Tax=Tropicimonas sp. IMCC6043 TaxID=2510645 RepID=UPI00101E2072|nr:HAMP domain-containing sensor histidine kinase [Tropicimonas sp. IMCC6043]RYH09408.1 HAMP domain-containing histidine kinase [Tropicimonas sp. IMCC6043]
MDRGNILSGAAFRAVSLSALLFLAVLVGAGFFGFRYVRSEMLAQTRDLVLEEEMLLSEVHRLEGHDAAVKMIGDLAGSPREARNVLALYAPTGALVAGRPTVPVLPDGWHQLALETARGSRNFLLHSRPLGTMTLVTGESLDLTRTAETTLLRALGTAGFVIVLTMLATGYAISAGSLRKLESMEATLDRIAAGAMEARLAVSGQNDQIDRIARRMNHHLDRLAELVHRKERSATAIAHDLRTPLARATLGLDRARRQAARGEDPWPVIDDVAEELTRLGGVVGTMLRIARIEAAEPGRGFALFEIAPVLEEIRETYAPLAEDNGQQLEVRAGPERLFGDPQMIAQLVANLVQNAITHAGPNARIAIDSRAGPDGAPRLSVSDTGPGMSEADRDRAFEAFFRADRSRSTDGTGLGLALVRAIADQHDAEVVLEDNGPGLLVRVAFPPA